MPLYLVATPIGNLEDITLRALRILREVALIAAEDTRTTGRLLARYDIETPLVSYHEFSGADKVTTLVERLASADVALVSDAGLPGLSDPGYRLIQGAITAGRQVVPIPGATAAVTALVASGLPTDRFLFLGFLPRRAKGRRAALAEVAQLPYTLVLYEAPHRLLALLADIEGVLGERPLVVAREMTKMYEELWRGTPSEAVAHFGAGPVRGELTLVIGGAPDAGGRWTETAVREAAGALVAAGKGRKEAARLVADQAGWRTREVYALLVN